MYFLRNNNIKYLRQLVTVVFMLLSFSALAQNFTASVSSNPVGMNERFQLTYTLEGTGTSFRPPSLSDFMVLSGPNQSSSMQVINGAVSQSISFSYILQPRKQGTFRIEPASIESNGNVVKSNVLTVNVSGTGGGSSGKNDDQDDKTNISTNNIFIRVSVDKTNVYRGEAVVATFKLYTNVQIVNYSINKLPSFAGFWSQDIELPQQLRLYNEVYNGINYRVGEIKKVVLFPQQDGTLTIEPMEGECIARIQVKRNRSGSPFDIFNDPFFNDPFFRSGGIRDVKFAVKSDPVKIHVKPLPPAPDSFNGAVGRFSIDGSIDKTSVNANDAVTLKVKISGKGNLKLLQAPAFELSPDIEKYDPKITDNVTVTEKGTSGSRTFEYLLIPRHQGDYEFGPLEFAYFDLDKKNYVTLKTPAYKLHVDRGKDGGASIAGTGRSDFRVIGRDIRFIKTNVPAFISATDKFYNSALFYLLLAIPFAGIIALGFYRRRYLRMNSDIIAVRSRKANKMARKRLAVAKKLLNDKKYGDFFDETGKAIWGYLSDRLKIPVSSLTRDSVTERLTLMNIPPETIKKITDTLEYCEFARYSRAEGTRTPESVYEDVVNLITSAEDEFKSI